MAINSIGAITGPGGIQYGTIPTVDRRPVSLEELNSGAWVAYDPSSHPHWEQLESYFEVRR